MSFKKIHHPHQSYWLHESKPVFISHYPATRARGEYYQAYKAIQPVPAGRMPWTIDNRRIGGEDGFLTLEEAMGAGNA